jgi:hypothetical protein
MKNAGGECSEIFSWRGPDYRNAAIIHASPEQGETDYLTLLVTTMVIRPAALWPSAAGCPFPAEVMERKGRSQFLILV